MVRSQPLKLWTPATIARELKLRQSTVSKEMHRMVAREYGNGDPPLVRVEHGLYRCFRDMEAVREIETPPPMLHGIQLSCSLPQNRGWGVRGEAAPSWGPLRGRTAWSRTAESNQYHLDDEWAGRHVTIAVSPSTGNVQVSLAASRTEDNVRPEDFGRFLDWLSGVLRGHGIVWNERDAHLDNIELNADYRGLALADVKRMRLKSFKNAWAQVYQKTLSTMRAEIRISHDGMLTLDEARRLVQALGTKPDTQTYSPPPPDPHDMGVA